MNRILFSAVFLILSVTGFSQKIYFVYLQTENEQPFYVRMDKSTYSSSASGYLILPKLKDSTYSFTIGFPQNKWPEQKFSVGMNKKDHGYLVKNFGDKGWGLFDLQTLAVQMSAGASAKINSNTENKEVSPFTDILAKAADDPSIKETMIISAVAEKGTGTSVKETEKKETAAIEINNTVTEKPAGKTDPVIVKKEEPKVETRIEPLKETVEKSEPVIVKKEEPKVEDKVPVKEQAEKAEPVIVKTEESKKEIKEQPASKQEETVGTVTNNYKPSTIIKRSETPVTEGVGIVFIDQDNKGASDTISLIIPDPKPVVAPKEDPVKEEKKFIEILTDEKPVAKTETRQFYREMNNCPSLARESDFLKLRKLMATAEVDDRMITEAEDYFKVKCFSTQQIKNLGVLFLTDEGKYNFFVTAYYHVSDKNNFSSLLTELKDENYLAQFKTMLGK